MKCNFKDERETLFGSQKPTCKITREDCVGEDNCIFFQNMKDKKEEKQ